MSGRIVPFRFATDGAAICPTWSAAWTPAMPSRIHGHPGSRLEARFAHRAAAEADLLVIALDRPGYGLSDFQSGRVITGWPADVAEAADLLRIGRFSVAGASGGELHFARSAERLCLTQSRVSQTLCTLEYKLGR
jgi:pimeloyl-ACP methyl ester carboxylesterase